MLSCSERLPSSTGVAYSPTKCDCVPCVPCWSPIIFAPLFITPRGARCRALLVFPLWKQWSRTFRGACPRQEYPQTSGFLERPPSGRTSWSSKTYRVVRDRMLFCPWSGDAGLQGTDTSVYTVNKVDTSVLQPSGRMEDGFQGHSRATCHTQTVSVCYSMSSNSQAVKSACPWIRSCLNCSLEYVLLAGRQGQNVTAF